MCRLRLVLLSAFETVVVFGSGGNGGGGDCDRGDRCVGVSRGRSVGRGRGRDVYVGRHCGCGGGGRDYDGGPRSR